METGQTVFMITHDVDEAIYLADRIVMMSNGPDAVFAEIVENPLPKDRKRTDFHKHPLYYGVRNHIIDFLVTRSKSIRDEIKAGARSTAAMCRWCVRACRSTVAASAIAIAVIDAGSRPAVRRQRMS